MNEIIEAALECIADTSWSSEGGQRSRLYHALKDHLGEDSFRRKTNEIYRREHAYEIAWRNLWNGIALAGAAAVNYPWVGDRIAIADLTCFRFPSA